MKNLLLCFVIFICAIIINPASSRAQFADSSALFVVADANTLNNAEIALMNFLQDMGFEVSPLSASEASDDATEGMSLVLISATVSSGTTATNLPGLREMEIPVINWEPALYDELGFSEANGSEVASSDIIIVSEGHPMAAGLPEGLCTIASVQKQVSYGVPEGNVQIIAVNPTDVTQAVLFAYEKGDSMFADIAPARRVGTFLLNDVADSMTDEGWLLFGATVKWAMSYSDSSNAVPENLNEAIAKEFILHNNYPNPFNPITYIKFSIPKQSQIELSIWNSVGEKVTTLVDEIRFSGTYTVPFDATSFSSGMYFYSLKAGDQNLTNKMMLLK
jgi:hypothetical protein